MLRDIIAHLSHLLRCEQIQYRILCKGCKNTNPQVEEIVAQLDLKRQDHYLCRFGLQNTCKLIRCFIKMCSTVRLVFALMGLSVNSHCFFKNDAGRLRSMKDFIVLRSMMLSKILMTLIRRRFGCKRIQLRAIRQKKLSTFCKQGLVISLFQEMDLSSAHPGAAICRLQIIFCGAA